MTAHEKAEWSALNPVRRAIKGWQVSSSPELYLTQGEKALAKVAGPHRQAADKLLDPIRRSLKK